MAARSRQINQLPHVVNDVLVTTAKAFRAARPDGKGNPAAAAAAMETRVPAAVEKFNAILDDMEYDLLLTKAVLDRDLKQLRAKRQPPPPEQKPVAPPAPMVVDLASPKMTAKEPVGGLTGPSLPGKQAATKPVAPFPNMGFDATSPKVAPVPSPKTTPKTKDVKSLARPAVAAAAAGRPASAPPRKVPPPQVPRPGGIVTAPQTPLHSSVQTKASSVPVANMPTPSIAPGLAPASTGNGNLFTDMTFSLVPPSGDPQIQKQAVQAPKTTPQQQPQPPSTDIPNPVAGNVPNLNMEQLIAGPADVANMDVGVSGSKAGEDTNIPNVDDKIDGLFDLGPGGIENMDLEYDLGNGDNSNFNDMYFPTGDSNGGAGEFDDAFFNLNG
ncbi:hypothetical protein C8A00DRAFT_43437 [Chaetomidium leptoderma]|uniref:Uncharacterized protein n=1 Tax=Chaetomidium leptoderma TaxID=669021 RepID=A0AAN6VLB8_9PEZI|nr:hypothetical protein C8A00DRAFT_43437 [Chaetomidium leptoderma]